MKCLFCQMPVTIQPLKLSQIMTTVLFQPAIHMQTLQEHSISHCQWTIDSQVTPTPAFLFLPLWSVGGEQGANSSQACGVVL